MPQDDPGRSPDSPQSGSARRSRRIVLAVLGMIILAAVVLAVVRQREAQFTLTQPRLEEAMARWKSAGVQDYRIEVRVQGSTKGAYDVEVRGGRIQRASQNGIPFEEPDRAYPWTVMGLFTEVLEQDLTRDKDPRNPPAYTQAHFHPALGYPERYVRSSGRHQVMIDVRVSPLP